MNDEELINLIVRTWVNNGGEHLGFTYLQDKIKDRIKEIQS